jgi:hypothetical protein
MKLSLKLFFTIISLSILTINLNAVHLVNKSTHCDKKQMDETTYHLSCPTDINRDGITNNADLSLLLKKFGQSCKCREDVSGDGIVSAKDLGLLLQNFNVRCKCADGEALEEK